MKSHAYLCIVTWPDGTEGLLFPRPGNVPIADTEAQGRKDFETAVSHMTAYFRGLEDHNRHSVRRNVGFEGAKIRLVKFQCLEVLAEHVHGQ